METSQVLCNNWKEEMEEWIKRNAWDNINWIRQMGSMAGKIHDR